VSTPKYDVVLVGAGIMSATLGSLLKELDPSLSVRVFERLERVADESSNPWNNAGTGHAALCELNYMPDSKDGSLPSPAKAIAINEQFQLSRQYWSHLVKKGVLADPKTFIHACPHMTFVTGAKDVDYLQRRFQALQGQPLFSGMQFSTDAEQIAKWTPLLIEGRTGSTPIAATRIDSGTDVDFGAITSALIENLRNQDVQVATSSEVIRLTRIFDGWQITTRDTRTGICETVNARFVFVGAGGYALKLLQKSRIAEAKGYGTFPVGGQFLRTDNPAIVARHQAKVYSQAAVGAPPMSVPHLDTRVVNGKASLLFGPYAGANPKFLKNGSIFDLPMSLRPANLLPYISVGLKNLGLVKYLVTELLKSKRAKFESLREFMPTADPKDWHLYTAGQRAQVIKKSGLGGVLQFGTEVITSSDGSISGLLGASPGASTSVPIMLEVLERCFSDRMPEWEPKIKKMLPTYGVSLSSDPELAAKTLKDTAKTLKLA
jgi:malate dehydrogenase (quinone)